MLDAQARETDLHQVRRALGDDNFSVRCDMVAVRVRNERETFCVPRIEPEIVSRQVNPAVVANSNHAKNYFGIWASSMVSIKANARQTLRVDICLNRPLYYEDEICGCSFHFKRSDSFRSREGC